MGELLELKNIWTGYRKKPVLRAINLTLEEGKVYCLLGPNGSGKTTLFRLLTGSLKTWKGEIFWKNRQLIQLSSLERARYISYLPQGLPTQMSYTTREILTLGRFPHRGKFSPLRETDWRIIEDTARTMEIDAFLDRRISHLSGGEIQRVFIAQALVQEPELLLLDEPVSHLDLAHSLRILDLIRKIRQKGITIFMILHDINLASEYADYIYLLKDGILCYEGKPEEVLTYQILEEIYETILIVEENPFTGRPHIYLLPEDKRTLPRENPPDL